MSHHLDSPIARQDVRLDITDLYVFRGEIGTVFLINVCHSIAGDIPVPGYHPEGLYEFKIDLDADAVEDLTYRFAFDERDAAGDQRFVLRQIEGIDAQDVNASGQVIAEGVTGQEVTTPCGVRIWAGKAGDPFWIEPTVLHAVGHAFQDGTTIELGEWTPDQATNLFAGHTVYAIVLEVPDEVLLTSVPDTGHQIDVWAVATLATDAGGWRSINRIGLPMIHPLFTQFNPDLGNELNAGRPADDFATYGETAVKEIESVVRAYGSTENPGAYAERVAHRFFPNILPYTVGTAAAFSFDHWNGRSLTDNAPNVMFSLATNTPVALGIGKESVVSKPSANFPYVPAPETSADASRPRTKTS
ncbi:DUF4331 family protein [Methyloceanibacter caenitepidi]|uniref:DUF4331 domain-containing protein n=1 Tax=Methyloceanibacter caenitepidi TaxID=1384459 RepID=A0A0A8K1H7_9HYPH|nr:DUF4331 family protein [Methyloceanibacter caenitepidi]BAQ16661.1 hypothetical protein GL4_1203 [Methyloceanibacter caenitepidi]